MFGLKNREQHGRVGAQDRPHGTSTDADVTSRMAGTSPSVDGTPARHAASTEPGPVGAAAAMQDRDGDRGDARTGRLSPSSGDTAGHPLEAEAAREEDRAAAVVEDRPTRTITTTSRREAHAELEAMGVRPARTSAAAAFALVFGLAALLFGLTGILAPAAVLFGLIGIVLGVAGRRAGLRPGITGRGVATGGLVTAVLGLLLGVVVLGGLAVYVQQKGLDGLQQRIDQVRNSLPSGADVVNRVK